MLSSAHLFGQIDSIGRSASHELGTDLTYLVTRFFTVNSDNYPHNPYLLTYRYSKGKKAIRLGIGADGYRREDKENDSIVLYRSTHTIHIRLGYERSVFLSRKFDGYGAADVRYMYDTFRSDYVSTEDGWRRGGQTDIHSTGPALVFGVRWYAAPNLIIFTEAAFDCRYYFEKSRSIYTQVSDEPAIPKPETPISKTKNFSIDFFPSNFIMIAWRF